MRLDHLTGVSGVRAARAGFTIMEVLLALSLTIVIIGVTLGAVVTYSRAGAVASELGGLNATAKVLEDHLKRDLVLISRTRTFNLSGTCPGSSDSDSFQPTRVRLWLLDEYDGTPYYVDYAWSPADGMLSRSVDLNGADATNKVFENVASFHLGCLVGGQVTATAVLREHLEGAVGNAGQQVEVRVTSTVRMR